MEVEDRCNDVRAERERKNVRSRQEDRQFDPNGNLVDYRVPKTIDDINDWLDGPISPIEVIEWDSSLYFFEELSQPENISLRKSLWEKVYEEYASGKKVSLSLYKEQLFLRKYCFHPIESVELKNYFKSAYQECMENIEKLIVIEGMSQIKIDAALGPSFNVEMAREVLVMLENPSVENDIQIAKILRRLNYPIQAIFFLQDHIGLDKDKMIANTSLLATTIDLFTLDKLQEESIGSNVEKHSPFNSIEEFVDYFQKVMSLDKENTYIRKSFARWMLFDNESTGDEVLELQKWILHKTAHETVESRKMMAHQVNNALTLKVVENEELKNELVTLAKDILLTSGERDPEFSSMDNTFRLIVSIIRRQISNIREDTSNGRHKEAKIIHMQVEKRILLLLDILERHPKHKAYKGRHKMTANLMSELGEVA